MPLARTHRSPPMAPTTDPATNGIHAESPAAESVDSALRVVAEQFQARQSVIREQEETIRQLHAELKQTTFERDIYLRSLYHYSREELKDQFTPFTEEEIREMDESG